VIRARWVLLALVGVAVAAMGLATLIGPPDAVVEARTGSDQPVVATRIACPIDGGVPGSTDTIAATALPTDVAPSVRTAAAAAGDVTAPITVTPLAPDKKEPTLIQVDARGPVTAANAPAEAVLPWLVSTQGGLAPALVAQQSSLAQSDERRGLADAPCTAATSDAWFVGASGAVGSRARLILNNTSGTAALVDVEVWDEKGPVATPAAEDLGVPASSQKTLLLDALAPGSARLAVHVIARKGRVASAVQVYENAGVDPQGQSFLPATVPSTGSDNKLIVPGIPGAGDRTLMVAAPLDGDAIVTLRILGSQGPFSPAENNVVTVPSGTVLDVPVGNAVGGEPAAIELTSDRPIVAGLRSVATKDGGSPDFAYTAPAVPLERLGATLGARTTNGWTTDLVFTAGGTESGEATVDILDPAGAIVGKQDVLVTPGSTEVVRIAPPASGDRQTLVVRPKEPGALTVVQLITGSDDKSAFIDLLPVPEVATTVRVPDVAGDLLTGLS